MRNVLDGGVTGIAHESGGNWRNLGGKFAQI